MKSWRSGGKSRPLREEMNSSKLGAVNYRSRPERFVAPHSCVSPPFGQRWKPDRPRGLVMGRAPPLSRREVVDLNDDFLGTTSCEFADFYPKAMNPSIIDSTVSVLSEHISKRVKDGLRDVVDVASRAHLTSDLDPDLEWTRRWNRTRPRRAPNRLFYPSPKLHLGGRPIPWWIARHSATRHPHAKK